MTTITRTETLLAVENLSLSFGDNLVLRDINIRIDNLLREGCVTGQVVALLGRSGSGKTQFMRQLAGLDNPNGAARSGQIYVTDHRKPVLAGDVGMVMQNNQLFNHRTVLSNLCSAGRQHHYTTAEARTKSLEMLAVFGLEDKAHVYPIQLSGGQKQRVAIIQQLLCSEHFLLMDEPFASLDPVSVRKACALIAQIANQDDLNTIILTTHSITPALAIADTLWLLGREPDKPGSTIVETHDLIAQGLCWHPELYGTPAFQEAERRIRERFETL